MADQTGTRAGAGFQPNVFAGRGVCMVAGGKVTRTTGALGDRGLIGKIPKGAEILAVYRKLADMDSNGTPTRVEKISLESGTGGADIDLLTGLGPAAVTGAWADLDFLPTAALTEDKTIACQTTTAAATHANGDVTVIILYVMETS